MEKWKEFIKGAYLGFLGVGLLIFMINDIYLSLKVPSYHIDFQKYWTLASLFVVVPISIKAGAKLDCDKEK